MVEREPQHESSSAQTFLVTVPDEAGARAVADELARRGHLLVAIREVDWAHRTPGSSWFGKPSLRPDDAGMWDVSSVATGPLPDADERWWQAQEDQAVRELASRLGGRTGSSGGGSRATVMSTFTRVGLVHELDDATMRQRRAAALADTPPRSSDDRDVLRVAPNEHELPDGSGAPVDLSAVGDVGWGDLDHAYGPAGDVPTMLAGLAANDDRWDEHLDDFIGSVTHQGSNYSSTAPAMRLIADLAVAPQLSGKRRLDLLYALFLGGSAYDRAVAYGYQSGAHDLDVRGTVVAATPRLVTTWGTVSDAERRLLLVLAALAGTPAPGHDLPDGASVLATAMLAGEDGAVAMLQRMARREEVLIQLATGGVTPARARLVAALEVLLWTR